MAREAIDTDRSLRQDHIEGALVALVAITGAACQLAVSVNLCPSDTVIASLSILSAAVLWLPDECYQIASGICALVEQG